VVAVSHSLLVVMYHIVLTKHPYVDLGADYLEKLDTARVQQHHIYRLEQVGYTVTLTPKKLAT
jgi:transposase